MTLSKEAKTGLVVTLGIGLFIFGFNFLKGRNIFTTQRTFYAVYNNIDGLVASNPVQLNGYNIGIVNEIKLIPDNSGRILVSFSIKDDKLNIPKNSIARVISSDLLGSKAIALFIGASSVYAQSGDTLNAEIEDDLKKSVNKTIAPLQKKAEGLISSIDSVMIVVQEVLNKDARENLSKSFASIQKSLETFEKTSVKIDGMVDSERDKLSLILSKVASITSNIERNNTQLTNVINNFSTISDSLAKANIASTINNTNKTMAEVNQIMDKINKGEGTMGMLINNDGLYKKLDNTSASLDKLLNDLRINPERYIHFSLVGRKDRDKPKN